MDRSPMEKNNKKGYIDLSNNNKKWVIIQIYHNGISNLYKI